MPIRDIVEAFLEVRDLAAGVTLEAAAILVRIARGIVARVHQIFHAEGSDDVMNTNIDEVRAEREAWHEARRESKATGKAVGDFVLKMAVAAGRSGDSVIIDI